MSQVSCQGCGTGIGNRTVVKSCRSGCCRLWCCPDCGARWASDGPVGCPTCNPISRWGGWAVAVSTRCCRLWWRLTHRRISTRGDTT